MLGCKRQCGYLKRGDLSLTDPIWEFVALSTDYVASTYVLHGYKKADLPFVLLPILRTSSRKQPIITRQPSLHIVQNHNHPDFSYKPSK